MCSNMNVDCAGGEVVEPVDRVSLRWPVLAGGLCWCASVIASTLGRVCPLCGNRELQADEGTPGPPALTTVGHRVKSFLYSVQGVTVGATEKPIHSSTNTLAEQHLLAGKSF